MNWMCCSCCAGVGVSGCSPAAGICARLMCTPIPLLEPGLEPEYLLLPKERCHSRPRVRERNVTRHTLVFNSVKKIPVYSSSQLVQQTDSSRLPLQAQTGLPADPHTSSSLPTWSDLSQPTLLSHSSLLTIAVT